MGCASSSSAMPSPTFNISGRHAVGADLGAYHYVTFEKACGETNAEIPPFIGGAILSLDSDNSYTLVSKWGITDHKCYVIMPMYVARVAGKFPLATFVLYTGEPKDGSSEVVPKELQNQPMIIGGQVEHKTMAQQVTLKEPQSIWGITAQGMKNIEGGSTFELEQQSYNHQAGGDGYLLVTFHIGPRQSIDDPYLVAKTYNTLKNNTSSINFALLSTTKRYPIDFSRFGKLSRQQWYEDLVNGIALRFNTHTLNNINDKMLEANNEKGESKEAKKDIAKVRDANYEASPTVVAETFEIMDNIASDQGEVFECVGVVVSQEVPSPETNSDEVVEVLSATVV